MNVKSLLLLGLVSTVLLVSRLSAAAPPEMDIEMADLWYQDGQFPAGSGEGIVITPEGMTAADDRDSVVYTSPILDAPIAYNAVVPEWLADLPEGTEMEFFLRTGSADGEWSPWYDIHGQPDWMLPDEQVTVGEMITVPAADKLHQKVQFSVEFIRGEAATMPRLQRLRLTFIDSTAGPTAEEMLARQQELDQGKTAPEAGYPKPTVVSREVWCTHPDCDYTDGLVYRSVSHLILHHTVSNNSSSDWAAVVRAIWSYHTYTRGWGDIGYNYLVDMDGVLYEGHLGGDDVKGTHAAGANLGSMALALIGNFVSTSPPAAMLDSAADLFAWKADQKGIDVFDASNTLPDIPWGLPHLMGHRDVYGGTNTQCPGTEAHELLPWLRNEVAARIGFTTNRIYIDELSSAFTKSNANWYAPAGNCGNNGHTYYTWSTTDPAESANWGEWRPNVPATGRYEIEVYAPYCDTNSSETDGARYTIQHANGTNTVIISQDDGIGTWMSLGEYDLLAGTSTVIHLTDLTSTDSNRAVWFDAIRLTPEEPVPPTVAPKTPGPNDFLASEAVSFNWEIMNTGTVLQTKLQVATDLDFSDLVVDKSWNGAATSYIHTFDQEYQHLFWRVILTTTLGSPVVSAPTHFRLDLAPPTSAVTAVVIDSVGAPNYRIFWAGEDAISGISSYNIDYQPEGATSWTRWLTDTINGGATFTPPEPGLVYSFRSQAIDKVGHTESPHSSGDLDTNAPVLLMERSYLPVLRR